MKHPTDRRSKTYKLTAPTISWLRSCAARLKPAPGVQGTNTMSNTPQMDPEYIQGSNQPAEAFPSRRSKSRKGWRKRTRGAEIVEVTLILAPLLGITFLLLDLSMAICLRSTFQHAVREGVRYAITGQNSPGPCQDDSVKAFVQSKASGFLSGTTAYNALHVHFIDPVNGAVTNNAGGNIVEVSVEGYQFNSWAPYLSLKNPVTLWARAYDVMEPIPAPLPCITKSE